MLKFSSWKIVWQRCSVKCKLTCPKKKEEKNERLSINDVSVRQGGEIDDCYSLFFIKVDWNVLFSFSTWSIMIESHQRNEMQKVVMYFFELKKNKRKRSVVMWMSSSSRTSYLFLFFCFKENVNLIYDDLTKKNNNKTGNQCKSNIRKRTRENSLITKCECLN